MFLGQFFVKNAKNDHKTYFPIKIGGKWKIRKSSEYVEMTWEVAVFGIQMALQMVIFEDIDFKFGTRIHRTSLYHIYSVFFENFRNFGYMTKIQNFEFKLTQFSKFSQIWKSEIAD